MTDILVDRVVNKSRKSHRCIWCGERIVLGTSYLSVSGLYDGEAVAYHYHHECNYAMQLEVEQSGGYPIEFTPGEGDRAAALEETKP